MIYYIPLAMIEPNPWQTRTGEPDPEYLESLAEDISKNGLLQTPAGRLVDEHGNPVTKEHFAAMQITDGSWLHVMSNGFRVQLAFGHNRLAAFRRLMDITDNSKTYRGMPVEMRFLEDSQMAAFAWSENERRKDLTPMERARAIRQRIESFGWTQEQAGKELQLSRSTVANILRLLDLPEEIGAEVHAGTLSERQAQALVPMADLPADVRQAAEKSNYRYYKPSEIVSAAKKGESSDQIRQRVKGMLEYHSVLLSTAAWPLDFEFDTGAADVLSVLQAAACQGCTHQIKRGEALACTVKACFEAKEEAWGVKRLQMAAEQTGVPVFAEGDEKAEVFFQDAELGKAILETKCEHLRLRSANWGLTVADGVAAMCCNPSGKCECLKRLEKEKRENDPVLKEEQLRKAALQKLYDEAGRRVGQALGEGQAGAWQALLQRFVGGTVNPEWTAERIREKIGCELVKPRYGRSQARRAVVDLLQSMGLGKPEDLSEADEAARKFERIGEWMERLSEELPTAEAVRGNLANLEKLRAVVEEDLQGEVDDARQTLQDVLDAIQAEDWRAEEFHWVQDVLQNDGIDGEFEDFVVDAPVCALRYALALVKQTAEYEYEAGVMEELLNYGDTESTELKEVEG